MNIAVDTNVEIYGAMLPNTEALTIGNALEVGLKYLQELPRNRDHFVVSVSHAITANWVLSLVVVFGRAKSR